MKQKVWIVVGLIILLAVAVLLVKGKLAFANNGAGFVVFGKTGTEAPSASFAQCLTEKGVKMYGAFWCPHCQNEKKKFGSTWEYIYYVECSLPSGSGQTEACKTAGVQAYPTWEFGDGSRIQGEVSFETLSAKSGCALTS
ncbi:hypothetical protein HZB02_06905 [Candidatus Woesearchaeota archaeon]|nr:hypothetical protein [Candidatus Woesearchaeota archaeon]